jgi:hypothetical protein
MQQHVPTNEPPPLSGEQQAQIEYELDLLAKLAVEWWIQQHTRSEVGTISRLAGGEDLE